MMNTTAGRNTLFRMNSKRTMIMESAISTIRMKVESDEGFGLLTANAVPDPTVRANSIRETEESISKYKLANDVLRTIASHTNERNRKRFCYEDRIWNNEWDIPLETFNIGIESCIELFTWYENQNPRCNFRNEIELLSKLKAFRNKSEGTVTSLEDELNG